MDLIIKGPATRRLKTINNPNAFGKSLRIKVSMNCQWLRRARANNADQTARRAISSSGIKGLDQKKNVNSTPAKNQLPRRKLSKDAKNKYTIAKSSIPVPI